MAGGTVSRQVDLGSIKMLANDETGSQPVSSVSLWYLLQFLCESLT